MNATERSRPRPLSAKVRRVWSLVRKETHQIVRDPSSIAVGVVLPVILILVFGYGLSLDVMNVPVAVVLNEAVELAKRYGTAEGSAFVNGLLERAVSEGIRTGS